MIPPCLPAGLPFGIGDAAVDAARAESCGEGEDRQLAEQGLVETPGAGRILRAVLVHRNPQRTQRFDVHQQVVHHHAHVAEAVDELVGQHHAVHAAERMVRDEQVAPRGVDAFEPLDRIGDLPLAEAGADELLRRQRPVVFEDVVDLPLVDRAAQPVTAKRGIQRAAAGAFSASTAPMSISGMGTFGKLYPTNIGILFRKIPNFTPK